jgi:CBS domain-containing protein
MLRSMTDDADTITSLPSGGGAAPVSMFASDAVITLPSGTTLQSVADELAGDQIGLVVLGSPGDVEAVISERDVVRAIAEGLDPLDTPAAALASTNIVWCDETATVNEVAAVMMAEYVRHVLLEDDGQLVSIVSVRDLLAAYTMAQV